MNIINMHAKAHRWELGIMMKKILVVEDDTFNNNLLCKILTKQNYEVTPAYAGSEAKLLLSMQQFDLILLDLMLPGLSGEELIIEIRKELVIPVIIISAKSALEDKVKLLKLGVDDYITKPYEKEEVLARVEAQLRRSTTFTVTADKTIQEYKYKNLYVNENNRTVKIKEKEINLTISEFDILLLLIKNKNKVFSKNQIYQEVWQGNYLGEDNTINVHISNIRGKIAKIEPEEEYIKTVWGIGFIIQD